MQSNLDVVKALYAAFAEGDMDAAAALMADDMEWREAENYVLADRNPYIGPAAVIPGVFGRTAELFETFAVEVGTFVADGDTVAMQGRYRAVAKATGIAVNPEIVHWFTLREGRIASFRQHVDTLAMARALGPVG